MIRLGEAESLGHRLGDEDGTITFANGVGEISLKEEAFNMLRYQYTRDDGRSLMFQWVTDIRITGHNAERLCRTGRGRWKVENEGFNFQKNGIFQIGHLCSRDSNAMKIHFLVTQVADILMQPCLAFDKAVNYRAVSIKTAARDLLASFQKDCFLATSSSSPRGRHTIW